MILASIVYAINHLQADKGIWYWCVHFRRRGQRHYKRFYEPRYGGSRQALKAAIVWRDQQLAKAKILTIREFHEQKRSNNRSGVTGVHFHRTPAQPLGFWQASIRFHDGKRIAKSFSVRKFGRWEALKHAIAARRDMLALVSDRPYLYDPIAKKFAAKSAVADANSRKRARLKP